METSFPQIKWGGGWVGMFLIPKEFWEGHRS